MIGKSLVHYKILEELGSGGMGTVYAAEDTKLNREIALKVLPSEAASHPDRLMRFEREAQAIAALNHPNIVQVHSIEDVEGVHFITMERVRGKTLTELIPKDGLALNRFFTVAIPLADAVAAAHQRGITHRDLKPDNMMLSAEWWLKILDFGLAKFKQEMAASGVHELPTRAATEEGRILGTVAYMSPEQAEGKTIDHRSDIFSIGIILYEMTTGQKPFRGDTSASLLSSIIKDTPSSVTDINPDIPRELGRIIRRCLAKDSGRRYQTAIDVRNELEELKAEWSSGELQEATPSPKRSGVKPWLIGAAAVSIAVLAITVGILTYSLRQPAETDNVPRLTNPVQVTSVMGVENYPTWSPEGRLLAYESRQSGNLDIWVTQLGSAEPVNLTADHKGVDSYPSWSPDGNQIAFFSQRDGGGVYVMSALGGRPRKVLSGNYANGLQWSADGTEIACPKIGVGCFVDIVTLSNLETRRVPLAHPEGLACRDLSWSPNGQYFAYVVALSPTNVGVDLTQIWVVPASGGEAIPVTDYQTANWTPTWSTDGRNLFFISNRGGSMDLWQQYMDEDGKPAGEPERVTTGLVIRSTAFSRDGSKLAYSRFRQVANIWRVPILEDRPATWADAMQITFDEAFIETFDLSPDGKRLALDSDRSGNDDLWLIPSGGGEMEQLTTGIILDWAPRWSPDGKEIAFFTNRSGNRDIWIMPADGGPARQLTHHESFDTYPTWSPDGREIAFNSGRSGNLDIWTIPAEGGEPRQITVHLGPDVLLVYSPDGKWIIFRSPGREGVNRIWRIPVGGGKAEPVTEEEIVFAGWSPDGKELYFHRAGNLWALSIEDGTEVPVTHFEGRKGGLGWTRGTDGQYLYFKWRDNIGDIWVMDVDHD